MSESKARTTPGPEPDFRAVSGIRDFNLYFVVGVCVKQGELFLFAEESRLLGCAAQ